MTEFGIQMYSLRDITKSDMNRALCEIARMGYKTAEFAGFFGYKSEYIKGLLDKYGIKAVATHTGYGDLVNNFAATVAYHKAIGCTDIIIPGASVYDRKGIEEFIENVNKWIPALKAEGITLHYPQRTPSRCRSRTSARFLPPIHREERSRLQPS